MAESIRRPGFLNVRSKVCRWNASLPAREWRIKTAVSRSTGVGPVFPALFKLMMRTIHPAGTSSHGKRKIASSFPASSAPPSAVGGSVLDDDALCSQCICIANYGGLSLTFLPGTI